MVWVTQRKLEWARGYTPGQVKGRIQRRLWVRGIEFVDVDGTRLFSLSAIDDRAEQVSLHARPTRNEPSRTMKKLE